MSNFKKWLSRVGTLILVLFAALVFYRMFVLQREKQTAVQVAKIHATKLTLDDVMGKNLPPPPSSSPADTSGRDGEGKNYDATIQGVDANKNGIRDDVELAIFREYPNSAKTRAPLLQYALALQTQMTLPLENAGTVTATVEDIESRANVCLWSLSSRSNLTKFLADMDRYENFVKNLQLNTTQRVKYLHDLINNNLQSGSLSNEGCDVNTSKLQN